MVRQATPSGCVLASASCQEGHLHSGGKERYLASWMSNSSQFLLNMRPAVTSWLSVDQVLFLVPPSLPSVSHHEHFPGPQPIRVGNLDPSCHPSCSMEMPFLACHARTHASGWCDLPGCRSTMHVFICSTSTPGGYCRSYSSLALSL